MRAFLSKTVEVNMITYVVLMACTTYFWMSTLYEYVVWERPMKQCARDAERYGPRPCEIRGVTVTIYPKENIT